MKLKFIKDHGDYKKGDVKEFSGTRGDYFLRRGSAKRYTPKRKTKEEKFTKETK